jgi:hypothetical protein
MAKKILLPPPSGTVEIHVAADGDDASPGDADRPVRTLQRAVDLAVAGADKNALYKIVLGKGIVGGRVQTQLPMGRRIAFTRVEAP